MRLGAGGEVLEEGGMHADDDGVDTGETDVPVLKKKFKYIVTEASVKHEIYKYWVHSYLWT